MVASEAARLLAGDGNRAAAAGDCGKMASTMSRGATVDDTRKNRTRNDTVITEKAGSER